MTSRRAARSSRPPRSRVLPGNKEKDAGLAAPPAGPAFVIVFLLALPGGVCYTVAVYLWNNGECIMTELIQESTLAEYEAFVQSHPKGHFAQSSLWAKQKPAWKWRAIVSRGADGRIRGSIAFLIRTMPYIHKTMLYACRGPVCDLDDRETFGELVAAARELAKEYKAYVIKIDPDVPVENEDFRPHARGLRLPHAPRRQEFRGDSAEIRLPPLAQRPHGGRAHGLVPPEVAL